MKTLRFAVSILVLALAFGTVGPASASPTTTGTWTLFPAQSVTTTTNTFTAYSTSVQQPINADGSSNFKSNGNAVIPVKFSLSTATATQTTTTVGPVMFDSILSDSDPNNDFAVLRFVPSTAMTFSQLSNLSAVYSFTTGNCHGGTLAWYVRIDIGNDGNTANDKNVFIYYGDLPNFTDCTTNNQSAVNMIGQPDLRYDLSQVGGGWYDSYANALTLVGSLPVLQATLVIDGGWLGDQQVTLASATVNDNTWTPLPTGATTTVVTGPFTQTCELPLATVQVTKTSGSSSGPVNEPVSIQPFDNDMNFRVVDCKYMYNLATSFLFGVGRYKVEVVINGNPVSGAAEFDLR